MTRNEWRIKFPLLNKIQRTKDNTLEAIRRTATPKHPEWVKTLEMRLDAAIRDYNIVKEIEERYTSSQRKYSYTLSKDHPNRNVNPLKQHLGGITYDIKRAIRKLSNDAENDNSALIKRYQERLAIVESDLAIVNAMQTRYYK